MIGKVPTIDPDHLAATSPTLMAWADKTRTLKVRTNADTPADAAKAREFGAEGIGLCRTEHMFFEGQRIVDMRKMILADDTAGRGQGPRGPRALPESGLHRHLRGDGRPAGHDPAARPAAPRVPAARRGRAGRGRQAARHPGREGQAPGRAAPRGQPDARPPRLPAADQVTPRSATCRSGPSSRPPSRSRRRARSVLPEIMIPLVGTVEELSILKKRALGRRRGGLPEGRDQGRVPDRHDDRDPPRRSDGRQDRRGGRVLLVRHQRPDADDLRLQPRRHRLVHARPTSSRRSSRSTRSRRSTSRASASSSRWAPSKGRKARKDKHDEHLKVGICGEHGGDPDSVVFCHKVGMDYVSCSPFRVPIARLAAAQAALGAAAQRDK